LSGDSRGSIVVAGAGIGGLAAALAAARAGYDVTVLERAIELEEAGAGVQLAANATRCLAFLGVFERLRPTAVRPEAFQVIDGISGQRLTEARMGRDAQARFGAPFLVIHRADLQAALLDAVREEAAIDLRLGRTVEEFAVHAGTVAVLANRGGETEEHRALALVGADGIRSTIRDRLGGRGVPVFRHRAAWRATVGIEHLPPRFAEPVVRLFLGPDAHIVSYPVRAGNAVNLVVVTADRRPSHGWGIGAGPEELTAPFARWSREVRTLIAAPERWLRWAMFDLDPLRKPWGTGPVTLLGDAAHAMLPFLAQGAAQALEDACVLGLTLGEAGDNLVPALRVYEQRRAGRVTRVQNAARANDRIYHLGGAARLARDLVLRAQSGAALMERYGWIYRWGP
jgi:salicylate hydroxylase